MLTYASTRVPRNSRWEASRPRTTVCTPCLADLHLDRGDLAGEEHGRGRPARSMEAQLDLRADLEAGLRQDLPPSSVKRSTKRSGTLVLSST